MRGSRDDAFLGGLLGAIVGPPLLQLVVRVARILGFYGLMVGLVFVVLIPAWARVALVLAVAAGIGTALWVKAGRE